MIRDEKASDEAAIYNLTACAFADMPYSDGREPDIINALRQAEDLHVSLVLEKDDKIIGHIAFSPVKISGQTGLWYGLGPVSIDAECRRQGYAKMLIAEGLSRIREKGAKGAVLIGNPDVYGGSGFVSTGSLTYGELDTAYVQQHVFDGETISGDITYAPGFSAGL